MRKSHLCRSWSDAAAASYGETIFFTFPPFLPSSAYPIHLFISVSCSSLLAEEFRLLPEIRLLQGDEHQTIHKQ
ncbi:hypothetical protein OUZ56_003515 [Daphnia magna]|uniref:Uncharacterized protein n=1 Tax=Daphnia magna TaxID=35525 RepID=A0ABR0A8Y2_9CRUS|nr:hypothetical protein OUZ56_003515 [Daphnia magna]